jgi:hypothetical protein
MHNVQKHQNKSFLCVFLTKTGFFNETLNTVIITVLDFFSYIIIPPIYFLIEIKIP